MDDRGLDFGLIDGFVAGVSEHEAAVADCESEGWMRELYLS
jgi:hypothetical protein